MTRAKRKITVFVNWVDDQGQQKVDDFFIQVRSSANKKEISAAVDLTTRFHAQSHAYNFDTQSWEWQYFNEKAARLDSKKGIGIPRFEPMNLGRLRNLASTIRTPKYNVGQIVQLKPDDRNEFCAGTVGLILGINVYNDIVNQPPYVGYRVQVTDDPPGEHNSGFDGFACEDDWTVDVFESQIVSN